MVDGRTPVDWDWVGELVAEHPQGCGVYNDVTLAGIDHVDTPDAPFEEFPRLATMGAAELAAAVATAHRYVALHHGGEAPLATLTVEESVPSGVLGFVADARAVASRLVVMTASSGAMVVFRKMLGEVVLVSATSTDPANDAYGFVDVNTATVVQCGERTTQFVDEHGESVVRAWSRCGSTWISEPKPELPLAADEIAATVVTALS